MADVVLGFPNMYSLHGALFDHNHMQVSNKFIVYLSHSLWFVAVHLESYVNFIRILKSPPHMYAIKVYQLSA